jgi:hypothetical protein
MYKLNSGEPYLENLINLRSKLKNSEISMSTLTEYASGGFPTDVIIISDTLEILNKLVILQARNESDNFFEKIINKFIIITPTSKINGLSGILFDIKKALNDSDFETVLNNIERLKPRQKKAFDAFVSILKDKKTIQTEIQLLNDVLINDIFF